MTTWRQLVGRFARLGWTGFGGPPAHVAQMRRQWVDSGDVEAQFLIGENSDSTSNSATLATVVKAGRATCRLRHLAS